MSDWNRKVILTVKDQSDGTTVKNRFPPDDNAAQSLAQILGRLQRGDVSYESVTILVTGVERDQVPVLITGGQDVVSEREPVP
ncbi:uncharacterized protein UMAG_11587 [Mycosarcoma maydis]|uniref:Uncharacterized protein n=1 Tax=Mycosarcoma maydis TaxID=5270 RepID=A0A0D1DT39_MYCMD|nr:uncharacterized protein UMAG_11587 [Ustilago maydis 521]KIS67011.1 hypothetical protein UMAG_11587 [Ustilago maydis 521]|eukprot:XP_011391567.1 hypothetical protein UMAG_11587 [Ustilago maydis 521]